MIKADIIILTNIRQIGIIFLQQNMLLNNKKENF